jgi:hypothetical protein
MCHVVETGIALQELCTQRPFLSFRLRQPEAGGRKARPYDTEKRILYAETIFSRRAGNRGCERRGS